MKRPHPHGILTALLLLFSAVWGQSNPSLWRLENRVQFLWEWDDNVEEALREPHDARSGRFLVHAKASRRGDRAQFDLDYQMGLQVYAGYARENKLINEVQCNYSYRLSKRMRAGLRSFGRLKLFLNRENDYAIGFLSPYFSVTSVFSSRLQAGLRFEGLEYSRSSLYDYQSPTIYVEWIKPVSRRLTLSSRYTYGTFNYSRQVVDPQLWYALTDKRQVDELSLFSVRMDWLWHGLLVNVSLNLERNRSNSYGFEYRKQFVTLLLAKDLRGVLLRCFGTWQHKTYLDELLPTWPIEQDTEREKSNFLVVDVSRDLSSSTTFLVRLAWYKNESPWANLYYEKWLVNMGMEFRVPTR